MTQNGWKFISKCFAVAVIIFTMLFADIAPIISLAAEGVDTEQDESISDRIDFNVNWNNSEESISCYAGSKVAAVFSLDLKGVRTGFKNLKIKVEDNSRPKAEIDAKTNNTSNSLVDVDKTNGNTLVFKNKIDSGVSSSGTIDITFAKATDFLNYSKEINFILTGEYMDPLTGETQYVQITKTLSATVSTNDEVSVFSMDADLIATTGNNNIFSVEKSTIGVDGSRGEWYATSVTAKVPVSLEGRNVTYGVYEYVIKRTSLVEDKSLISNETNCNIELINLPSYMNSDIQRNSDGSVNVRITVGEDKEEYTADDAFDFATSFIINVHWNIFEDVSRSGGESSGVTVASINAVGETKGLTITRSSSGASVEDESARTTESNSENVGISYYVGDYISNSELTTSSRLKTEWITNIEEGNTDFEWETKLLYWDRREESRKENLRVYSYRDGTTNNLQYKADDGTRKSLNLDDDELTLKSITVRGYDGRWLYADFYKKGENEPFFRADAENLTYTVPEGEIITDYYVIFSNIYSVNKNSKPEWTATYTLNIDKLSDRMSEEEIQNIIGITRYQQSFMGSRDETGNISATHYITTPSPVQRYSYFEVSSSNMNSAIVNYGVASTGSITLSMYKNTNVMQEYTYLRNQNPKFFIALPKCYDYENIRVTANGRIAVSNQECTDENEAAWYIDEESGYLVINCLGDWYDNLGTANISVTFTKRLNTYSVNANNTINAYMITDNENYICGTVSNSTLSKNGVTPAKVGNARTTFTIALDDNVKIRNGVVIDGSEIYPSSTSDNQLGVYENPILAKSGDNVQYKTELAANGSRLSNISFICKLPKQNNTSIIGDTYSLNSVNSLINLDDDINVRVSSGNGESDVNSSRYKIYYTTSDNCSFDSEWTEYVSGDGNLADAKAIKVQLDENYTLGSSSILSVYFNMEMPTTDGISGQISAVRFLKSGQTDTTELEPSAVYVEKGTPEGTITIQKIFQGYNAGSAPSGVSLDGIELKIINIKTKEALVIEGQTNSEGKFNVDSTGKTTLTGVPRGRYQVVELTETTGYEANDYVTFEIINGEDKSVTVTNYPVTCELTIHKVWNLNNIETGRSEVLDNQQGSVTLQVVRQGDSIQYSTTVTTDPTTGEATLYVPYGKYSIIEQSGLNGWSMSSTQVAFDVKQEHVDYVVANNLDVCGLTIEKTVPNIAGSEDTVLGIRFKIQGTAYADSYIDNNGERQYLEYEKTVTVGEDVQGVTQTISADQKKVTISLGTVYAGNYTITEIDSPTIEIDGQNVTKYADLIRSVSLTARTGNVVSLENVWKRGTIKIQKTADEGVELDKFKFRVHGTSYYGTEVDTILQADANGLARGNILLGEYRVEEVGTEAFDATYTMVVDGQEIVQQDYIDVKIKDSSVVNVNAHNVTTYGYVKVVKTIEGVNDPSKTQGIQFEVNGLAPSGENIHEVITIGNDGTGMSNAIPAGGEYVLSEVESSVPNNIEVADDVEVELTKHHTIDDPLVIDINNKRGKGNLEISTETIPEGGEVYPIVYKVQEIEIDESTGAYTIVEGKDKTVEGDLLGEAKLIDLPAGSYLVSQVSIPTGWIKDIPQIVDVPMYNTAYVNFVIEKGEETVETQVRVSKTIFNPAGTIAADADYTKYKLDQNQSFEAKLTNIETNKEYFVYMSNNNVGVLYGIPEGRYSIEEVYKPKYKIRSYNIVEDGVKTEIEETNGKYIFEIGSVEDGENIVNINVENLIDDSFGFGGQDSKDNLSKTDVETVVPEIITRTSLFVVDEDGEYIDGCTFDIYDSTGNKVTQISPKTKRTIVKGMDPGQYTIKNASVPNGYLEAEDAAFTVYEDAVRVVRVEVQKNIPRGNLTLQTVYTTENGTIRNVAKSQYKIVDSSTGLPITFIRKADGSYVRSNLPTATDTVSLRAGKVTLRGVETGSYEVGLIGMTENFGLVNASDVEVVNVVENETQDITIQTTKRQIIDIQASYQNNYIVDNCGALWGWGYNSDYNVVGTGDYSDTYEPRLLIPSGVKKVSVGYYTRAVIMDNGDLYTWGNNTNGTLGSGTTSTIITEPLSNCINSAINAKVVDVAVGYRSMLIVDEYGKLWYSGDVFYCGLGMDKINELRANMGSSYILEPICLTDFENSPFADITVEKIFCGYNSMCAIIDSYGRLWTFSGGNYDDVGYAPTSGTSECYEVTCVSLRSGNDIYEAYRNGVKIVDVNQCMAIDELGNVYAYGADYSLPVPAMKISRMYPALEGKKFIKAMAINGSTSTYNVPKFVLIDEDNKLYFENVCIDSIDGINKYADRKFTNVAIGYYAVMAIDDKFDLYGYAKSYSSYGLAGTDQYVKDISGNTLITFTEFQVSLPNYPAYFKYDMKFQKVVSNSYGALALDDDGNLWSWGHGDSYSNYNSIGNASGLVTKPRMIEFNEEIKFKDIEAIPSYYSMHAVDTKGRVWTWGYSYYYTSGAGGATNSNYLARICLSELEGNPLKEAYAEGVEIEEIKSLYYDLMVAKDNRNDIWLWGSKAVQIITDDPTVPKRISDFEPVKSMIYEQGKYVKKFAYVNSGLALLDNEGELWYVYNHQISKLSDFENSALRNEIVQNGISIVDIDSSSSTLTILDSLGRIWRAYSLGNELCLSTSTGNPIADEYANGNKIVYINSASNSGYMMAIDSKGRIWYDITSSPRCVADDTEYKYAVYGDSSYYAIDKDGHMWVWGSNNNSRLGIGIKNSITIEKPTITTEGSRNTLVYGKTFVDVTSKGVETSDGEIYRLGSGNVSFVEQTTRYLTNQGIEIKQEVDGYVLDTEGKLYTKVSGRWQCQTDVEGSDLYNAYYNEDIKIDSIIKQDGYGTSAKYYFLDSNNHLWDSSYKLVGNFDFKEIVHMTTSNTLAIDNNGDYWINGSNSKGLLGIGNLDITSSNEFIKLELDEDSKIEEIVFINSAMIYVKDQNSCVWAWGVNNWGQIGISSSTTIVSSPYCWDVQVQDIHVQAFNYNDTSYNVIALDTEGRVWSCGYGNSSSSTNAWARGALGKTSETLGIVDNSSQMGRIVKLTVSTDCSYAINEDGDLWVWGNNAYGGLGYSTSIWQRYVDNRNSTLYYYTFRPVLSPACVTNTQGVLRNKKIKDVIDICGYQTYYNEQFNGVYLTGNARVLVITEDGEVYKMGHNKVVNDYAKDMYTNASTPYPGPELMNIDGNIIDVRYYSNKEVWLKTDTGAVYQATGTSYASSTNYEYFYDRSSDEYADMSLDEIYEERHKNLSRTEVLLLEDSHTVRYNSYNSTGSIGITKDYSYPETIDAVSAYVEYSSNDEYTTIYIVDSNGDLWVKGSNNGLGNPSKTFECVTQKEFISEPVWNTIRGRWNVIYRKY